MAKILQKVFASNDRVSQSFTVQSWHVSQSVDAFTGASDYDITISGSLTVIGPVSSSGGFTGSLQGTASWANNAVTASYILNAVSASFASTASYIQNAQTASYVLNAVSASFSSTASFVNTLRQSVILTGSLETTGSVTLKGLTVVPKSFVVTIDNSTGQLFYTSSTGFLGSAGLPNGPLNSYQFNNAGTFSGSSDLTYTGGVLRATGSFTGSFTGNLTGTSSRATSSSFADNYKINYSDTTSGTFQLLYGQGGTQAYGNANITVDPSSNKLFAPSFVSNKAFNASDGEGNIYLNGTTGNRIDFIDQGYSPPSTTTRSTGTKIVLWPAVTPSFVDYAIGLELYTMWYSVPTSSFSGIPTNFKWYAGTTNIATLTGTGTFSTTGDIIAFASSDKNLKDNITPISNPIEKIQKIGGYEFDWNDKQDTYEGHDVGVIAQEIEEVLPELVQTRDNGYKAVKYEKIVALLIEAIKEQQKQIEELKSKIG